jgi:membrane protease YdiL (CAAX protease family)
MNNKVNPEKFRKLPIAALVTGILAFGNACLVFWVNVILINWWSIPLTILLSFWTFSLPIVAIVCGSIDLKRIKAGICSNKGRGFDIAGIVLGLVFIIIVPVFILLGD